MSRTPTAAPATAPADVQFRRMIEALTAIRTGASRVNGQASTGAATRTLLDASYLKAMAILDEVEAASPVRTGSR